MDNKIVSYSNKYGTLQLSLVSDYMPVKDLPRSKNVDPAIKFNIDTAEMIALVTGNRSIQMVVHPDNLNSYFVVHHLSGSIAAVCKIVDLQFGSNYNPTQEIAASARAFFV